MPLLSVDLLQKSPALLNLCGGKGRSLVKLYIGGYPVPPFLLLPSDQIHIWLAPIHNAIQTLLLPLNADDHSNIIKTAERIGELVASLSISADKKHSIINQCRQQFGHNYRVSVRSSALAEDGRQHSFAGQLDSFLYVPERDLLDSIKACIASLYSARSIKYRLSHGLSTTDSMAVVIQQMVEAEKSGVLFTINTAGNMHESAIAAAYGVGEGVVSDRADTDMFYIERNSNRVIVVTKKKCVRLDIDNNATQGTAENNVALPLQNIPVLTNAQVVEIATIGREIERENDAAQDIEFALDKSGKLYLLQARPITAIAAGELKILDNANIIESYPGVTLPLSVDFAQQAYRGVFLAAARAFKVPEKFITTHATIFCQLLIRVNGRVYYQLHNARKIMEKVLVSRHSQYTWREFIGLSGLDWPIVSASWWQHLRSLLVLLALLFTHRGKMAQLFSVFTNKYSKIQQFIAVIHQKTAAEIYTFYQTNSEALFQAWAPTIVNDYFAMKGLELYKRRLVALGLAAHKNLANDLLCGIEGMESEQPVILLLHMKDMINQTPELQRLFQRSPKAIWQVLEAGEHAAFKPLWDTYLDRFSDRTLEELKLETPTLKMQPWVLASMLQNQLSNNATLASFKQRQQNIRCRAEEIVDSRLKGAPIQRWIFTFLLDKARHAVKDRENMRINRARIYGAVKTMFLAIGKQMKQDALLEKPKDVFYLRLQDLRQYAFEGKRLPLQAKVHREQQAVAHYHTMEMPDRLIYKTEIPNLHDYARHPSPTGKGRRLKGIGVSKGVVTGKARVVKKPSMDLKIHGEILITRMTDPGWVFLMAQSAGIVSEKGSLLSHTAIIGREFGIPTVVGVDQITDFVQTGNQLEVNGSIGDVTILTSPSEPASLALEET